MHTLPATPRPGRAASLLHSHLPLASTWHRIAEASSKHAEERPARVCASLKGCTDAPRLFNNPSMVARSPRTYCRLFTMAINYSPNPTDTGLPNAHVPTTTCCYPPRALNGLMIALIYQTYYAS
ncbi:hypothetical protein BD410DRAFT_847276 [Rickenella mellea]|uniref:Uncharacterized protein n=1 Tax=Rickenella mellea TaxID=50990 RepID=A0A4Y7PD37_9AGAM|nr:hypothetical protein BD410DRAFT_847276 [Rickenella mellea]